MALDILHLNLLVHLGVLSIHAGAAFDTNAKIGLEPICSISLWLGMNTIVSDDVRIFPN